MVSTDGNRRDDTHFSFNWRISHMFNSVKHYSGNKRNFILKMNFPPMSSS